MSPSIRNSVLTFFVNGQKVEDNNVDPEWTLLYYLRNKLRLCGTKLGCAEGGCGACTVMISKYDRKRKDIIHLAVNACLAPVCTLHGLAVTTVEGIGSTKTKLHPVQERIAMAHGTQCGFCTPGIVMSMYTLLRSSCGKTSFSDMETAFQGNLCRCTGYRPIIEGYRTFIEDSPSFKVSNGVACQMGNQCCRLAKTPFLTNKDNSPSSCNGSDKLQPPYNGTDNLSSHCSSKSEKSTEPNDSEDNNLYDKNSFQLYDPSQELIFPPELSFSDKYDRESLVIQGPRVTCFRPIKLHELLVLKSKYPEARLVNGNTEVGIETKFKDMTYPQIIIINMIPELSQITIEENGLKIGAATTLSDLEIFLRNLIEKKGNSACKIFESILEMLKYFAGKQIRNVASVITGWDGSILGKRFQCKASSSSHSIMSTHPIPESDDRLYQKAIGGNIMTGSPISDLCPILMASSAELEFRSLENHRKLVMDETFWTGYRKNVVNPNEVLTSIFLPFTSQNQFFKAYKQARRRDDDIAIVNAAFYLELDVDLIKDIRISYGGMAPTTILANHTEKLLTGMKWNEDMLSEAFSSLVKELSLKADTPGGMVEYRQSLTLSFFFKFYLHVCNELEKLGYKFTLEESFKSALYNFDSKVPLSSQFFQIVSKEENSPVGKPVVHQSAFKHATGEAVYCDDIPFFENELYLALVISTRAHAKIVNIDSSEALKLDGVLDFVSAKDISHERNNFGSIVHDEEVFASEKVVCVGQSIGAVVAKDQFTAKRAAKHVKVDYEDIMPAIITTQEAIKNKSYFEDSPFILKKGDVQEGFGISDKIIEGDLTIGGQEHFYLETQACIVVPEMEDNELKIYAATQHPTEAQNLVSHVLGLPHNKVVCKVKRLGGGFGGKETRSACVFLPAAVAAHKLKRPVRIMLDRDEDMVITGHRHPFYGKYKVGFSNSGKINACEISLYCNAGCSKDLSDPMMERAMFHVSNTCLFENIICNGYVCKTNLPSNTAFRGFGAPQAMLIGETIIFHIADSLNIDPEQVHYLNFYAEGDITHFKQKISHCTVKECWNECIRTSNYFERKEAIKKYNLSNKFRKRGISIIPTMFGIGFSTPFMNQAGALVLIYTDGSVLLSHGGTEMGQGLHTKMIQVASKALGIPVSEIHISETATDKVPNTSPTAGSASSDLNGMAVLDACNKINKRLESIKTANPQGSWKDWISEAYFQRISLAASGFYKTPGIGLEPNAESGNIFNYFTYGAACSEVEVDCLTGDHQVLRTDIVMDLGQSLNPAIDIGQIEGAFMQGYGLFTLEELVYSPKGVLYSRGPGTYKIPGFADIPHEFNVALLKGSSNPRAVYSSKSTGEPPLFLAASIFFAIREAVKDSRKDNDLEGWFVFNSPASAEQIRISCSDAIVGQVRQPPGSKEAWNTIL